MQGIVAIALLVLLSGCATISSSGECTRFSAASRAYGQIFNPMDMQKKAIDECGRPRGKRQRLSQRLPPTLKVSVQ